MRVLDSRCHASFPVAFLLASLAWLCFAAPAAAMKLGVMGDSLSDEYAEETYGVYAENWVEQLVIHGGIDAGPTASEAGQPGGSWGLPRRTGYAYNWARAGATSQSLLESGQHTGLAGQVASEGIAHAVLAIGANDFHPQGNAYGGIYSGAWLPTQIDTYVNGRLANVESALDAILPTGVRLVLVNFPDYGITPTVRALRPDPAKRQLVGDVIAQVNVGVDAIAQARGLVLVDLFGASLTIFGSHASPNSTLTIGNVDIDLGESDTAGGGNPAAGFVHDGIHPNTTLQGVMANTFLEALNVGYGAGLPLFSEAEILAHRGLAYGGSDTLATEFGEYADYVTSYVPGCRDGTDNDGDGLADLADPGCADADDLSERSPSLACDDGADNDSDGRIDFDPATYASPGDQTTPPAGQGDPGCWGPGSPRENPQCQDGQHNDGDGRMDYDAGLSVNGSADGAGPDPQCVGRPWRNRERVNSCGLGLELALLLPALRTLRRRRVRPALGPGGPGRGLPSSDSAPQP